MLPSVTRSTFYSVSYFINQRHLLFLQEADKIVDDVMFSETTIEEKEKLLPETVSRHQFYQDLRGYLADLVECFNEKLANIKFVEDKYHKIKGDVTKKLIERRREDVRDQMRELSSVKSSVSYFLKHNSDRNL